MYHVPVRMASKLEKHGLAGRPLSTSTFTPGSTPFTPLRLFCSEHDEGKRPHIRRHDVGRHARIPRTGSPTTTPRLVAPLGSPTGAGTTSHQLQFAPGRSSLRRYQYHDARFGCPLLPLPIREPSLCDHPFAPLWSDNVRLLLLQHVPASTRPTPATETTPSPSATPIPADSGWCLPLL